MRDFILTSTNSATISELKVRDVRSILSVVGEITKTMGESGKPLSVNDILYNWSVMESIFDSIVAVQDIDGEKLTLDDLSMSDVAEIIEHAKEVNASFLGIATGLMGGVDDQ